MAEKGLRLLDCKKNKVKHTTFINYPSHSKHNICAYLETTQYDREFEPIIKFLKRSRIAHAISTDYPTYLTHQKSFWNSLEKLSVDSKLILRATINNQIVNITEEDIRRVLRFGEEPAGIRSLNRDLVKGCLLRMGYIGDINNKVAKKSNFPVNYKFLANVLVHCFGTTKGGFGDINHTLQSALVALVLNKPFNFSSMILGHLCENMTKLANQKFLLYPRFLQMIFDDKLGVHALPKVATDLMRFEHMTNLTYRRMKMYDQKKEVIPSPKRLIGHLVSVNYVAPKGKKWRHEDSDSDVEDMQVFILADDDDKQGGGGGVGSAVFPPVRQPTLRKRKRTPPQPQPQVQPQPQQQQRQSPRVKVEPQEQQSLPATEPIIQVTLGSAVVAGENDHLMSANISSPSKDIDMYDGLGDDGDNEDRSDGDQFEYVQHGNQTVKEKATKVANELQEDPDFEATADEPEETVSPSKKHIKTMSRKKKSLTKNTQMKKSPMKIILKSLTVTSSTEPITVTSTTTSPVVTSTPEVSPIQAQTQDIPASRVFETPRQSPEGADEPSSSFRTQPQSPLNIPFDVSKFSPGFFGPTNTELKAGIDSMGQTIQKLTMEKDEDREKMKKMMDMIVKLNENFEKEKAEREIDRQRIVVFGKFAQRSNDRISLLEAENQKLKSDLRKVLEHYHENQKLKSDLRKVLEHYK